MRSTADRTNVSQNQQNQAGNPGKRQVALLGVFGVIFTAIIAVVAMDDTSSFSKITAFQLAGITLGGFLLGLLLIKLASRLFKKNDAERAVGKLAARYNKHISVVSASAVCLGILIGQSPFADISANLQALSLAMLMIVLIAVVITGIGSGPIFVPVSGIDEKIDERERSLRYRAITASYLIVTVVFYIAALMPAVRRVLFADSAIFFLFAATFLMPTWTSSFMRK